MPIEGYSSITLSDEVIQRLRKVAEETSRTVPKVIEHMLNTCFPKEAA